MPNKYIDVTKMWSSCLGITGEPANGLAPAGDMEPPGGFKRIEMVDLCGLGSLLHSYWKCMIYPTKMSDFP